MPLINKPQETAQERYENERRKQDGSMWFSKNAIIEQMDWREQIAEFFFRRGEASGERTALERLAARASDDAEKAFWGFEPKLQISAAFGFDKGYKTGRVPLLAKIELLESIKDSVTALNDSKSKRIKELEAENKELRGGCVLNEETK
jgi:hypothetical protein